MNQQQDDHAEGVRISSQAGSEDEEICSNKATSGSSDPGSDDLGQAPTRSRSSERGPQRTTAMRLPRDQQTSQRSGPDTARAIPGTMSLGSSSFMGLTLAPLPSAMLPNKKRALDEVLSDETPPEKDKMSAEIEQLAGELAGEALLQPPEPHRQKRSKVNEEPSTPQAPPIATRDSAMNSDRHERRSEHAPDASYRGNRATSE
ncbi:hypothetical protein F4801DRAFT_536178 [Xylaria longipes]|nr:hypothetical protein F4801DRAFT_536178 [Xylaria longipes]RYC61150.1 hypothetical protein CHU98_g5068 [Xylaria longipes]